MANCVILHNPTNKFESSITLEDTNYLFKPKIETHTKSHQKNPFIKFTELPMLMHHSIDENFRLVSKAVAVDSVKLDKNQTLEDYLKNRVYSRDFIYVKTNNGEIEYTEIPTIYDPTNFSPIKCKLVRIGTIRLSDKEVEDLILKNRYYSELVPSQKLYYFEKIINNDPHIPEISVKLMESNIKLSDEGHSIYCELVNRLGIPRTYETLLKWVDRIENTNIEIPEKKENNNYMYTLIRRNGKYVR